jgi:beta-phosphoglucomutase-like phosphatase (HAD superfamily)
VELNREDRQDREEQSKDCFNQSELMNGQWFGECCSTWTAWSWILCIVQVKQYPRAFETIDELRRRGFKVALVTACALKNMQHSLNTEDRAHFDFIITGDEVPRAKPFPDPYLTAARRLGLSPKECLVVENAPLGIESARNAGMQCAAIETTLRRKYLASADYVLRNIANLLSLPMLRRAGAVS